MERTIDSVKRLYSRLRTFLSDREGATAIEYAVIAGLISIAIVAAATPIGTKIGSLMTLVQNALGP
ncbi:MULTISPECIES: Flp family type IVb pilin [Pseudomonas]|uniref:Flp family type IVb pilin n=1 Tax=Pseudomonas TaxID=286 RepID=UPI001E5DC5E1|nr:MULTISPECIES: Flp family type IVb pilin [Pseudomonas]MCE4071603.1 Flp family type IVb pilin [Pseudomonas nitritireducens]MCE4081379.1 Flp family type IVb pilin [Pseudomonas nitroreducens]